MDIMIIQGIECYEVDGVAYLKLETVARGLGFTEIKDGKEYVMWRRVDGYLEKFGFGTCAERPDFIPENVFYRLAMKAKNETAEAFQAKIADEIIPSIRKRGGYMTPEAEQQMVEGLRSMTALVQAMGNGFDALTKNFEVLNQRVADLEQGRRELKALPPGPERTPFDDDNPFADDPPRPASLLARKLWMRLAGEKLDLLSQRYGKSNNAVLHKIYQDMEEHFKTVMDEERSRVMEEQGLEKCSVLLAIFFDAELRDYFQRYVDYNLAPENRGW